MDLLGSVQISTHIMFGHAFRSGRSAYYICTKGILQIPLGSFHSPLLARPSMQDPTKVCLSISNSGSF